MKRGEHKMIEKTKVFENHSENEKDIITQVVNGLTGTDTGVDFRKNLVNDTEEEAILYYFLGYYCYDFCKSY